LELFEARCFFLATRVNICVQAPLVSAHDFVSIRLVQMTVRTILVNTSGLWLATGVSVMSSTRFVDTE
jgi:hypothetical protein